MTFLFSVVPWDFCCAKYLPWLIRGWETLAYKICPTKANMLHLTPFTEDIFVCWHDHDDVAMNWLESGRQLASSLFKCVGQWCHHDCTTHTHGCVASPSVNSCIANCRTECLSWPFLVNIYVTGRRIDSRGYRHAACRHRVTPTHRDHMSCLRACSKKCLS